MPIVIGIREMEYSPKLTLPDSPSTSGSFSPRKKIKKKMPMIIRSAPAIVLNNLINMVK